MLPERLEINIPPSVTTIAEAAVGRDTIMRAVASAVLQADAVEAALLAALPLGPQTPAGGITLPEAFKASAAEGGGAEGGIRGGGIARHRRGQLRARRKSFSVGPGKQTGAGRRD